MALFFKLKKQKIYIYYYYYSVTNYYGRVFVSNTIQFLC